MVRKDYANISMEKLSDILCLKTMRGRAAVNSSTVHNASSGTHFLQIPVRLYILLHFFSNSNTGEAFALDPEDLALQLGANVKSVKAGLKRLADGGFIGYSEEPDFVDVTIAGVRDMYKKRGEGGRGYITCGPELRDAVMRVTKINDLRIILRSLLQTVSAELTRANKKAEAVISMKDYRSGLPSYIKPCVIRQVTSGETFNTLFDRIRPDGKKSCCIRLKQSMNGQYTKTVIRRNARIQLKQELTELNDIIRRANAGIHESGGMLPSDILSLAKHDITLDPSWLFAEKQLPLLDLNSATRESCATMAQDYGIDSVISAVRTMYGNLVEGKYKYDSTEDQGGLVRKILDEMFETELLTA